MANDKVGQQLEQVNANVKANTQGIEYAMVIDGRALSYALSERLAPLLLEVCVRVYVCVCACTLPACPGLTH